MTLYRALLFFPAIVAHLIPFHWTSWLRLLLVAFVFEGAFRKWFFPGLSDFIYFSKDVIMIILICKYLHSGRDPKNQVYRDNAFHLVLVLLFALVTLNCFNPNLGSPLLGLLGLRSWFMAAPLVYIFHQAFRSRSALYRFLHFLYVLMIPVFLIVLVQVNSEPDAFINRYSNMEEGGQVAAIRVDDKVVVRVTGTFSYLSGLTNFCTLCLTILVPLFVFAKSRSRNQLLTSIEYMTILISVVVVSFSSGARAPVFYFVVLLILRFILFTLKGKQSFSTQAIVISLFAGLVIFFPMYSYIEHWIVRYEGTRDTADRLFNNADSFVVTNKIFGYGTGRTLASLNVLVNKFNLPAPKEVGVRYGDNTTMRLFIEEGLLGVALYFMLKLIILFRAIQIFDSLKSRFLQELAASAFIWHFVYFMNFPGLNFQSSILFWFFVALLYSLPVIERNTMMSIRMREGSKKRLMDPYGDSMITQHSKIIPRDKL